MTVVASPALVEAVAAYARRLHAGIGSGHHIASPLGAWLVLALLADAADPAEAGPLAEVLGMPAPEAARQAHLLLDEPHPAVAAAAAVWTQGPPRDAAGRWVAGLPAAVHRGAAIPTQHEADAWARDQTFGLIERFPLNVDPTWLCVLATALATRISWSTPFTTTSADAFRSDWRTEVHTVLRTPGHGHDCAIARHPATGDIGVHTARADGLSVTSVIAAPDVPADVVIAAAHDAAHGRVTRCRLADLPLGDGVAWTVTEAQGEGGISAVLPAWSASSEHNLRTLPSGFDAAAAVLGRLFAAPEWEAAQAAVARYHRTGFEAAAVTAVAVRLSMAVGRRRAAMLRFDRPYAVVATARSDGPGPWSGLPVFSAWVTTPDPRA